MTRDVNLPLQQLLAPAPILLLPLPLLLQLLLRKSAVRFSAHPLHGAIGRYLPDTSPH